MANRKMREKGIYSITNLVNGKRYIGQCFSSKGIRDRFSNHKVSLRKNKHCNIHLQSSWNKYGESNFKFEIIEKVYDKRAITEREQYWVEQYKTNQNKHGYNKRKCVDSNHGNKRGKIDKNIVIEILKKYSTGKFFYKDIAEEYGLSKDSIRYICKRKSYKYIKVDKTLEKKVFFISKQRIKNRNFKIGQNNINSKLTNEQRIEIYNLYYNSNLTQKEIGKRYGVCQDTVSRISLKSTNYYKEKK